jgi:hypothetical protein
VVTYHKGGGLLNSQKFGNVVYPHRGLEYDEVSNMVGALREEFCKNFVTVQEHFIAYCRCRETVKLFRFLLSLYSLIETCSNVQNCTFR